MLATITLEELEHDPYPFYAYMRNEQPVAFFELLNQWIVTRWEDCEAVGKAEHATDASNAYLEAFFGPNITTSSGDIHRWLRGGVDPPLRPRAVQGYIEQRARPIASEYVRRLAPLGGADATIELLELISVRVIGDVLGLGDVDDATLQRWFQGLNTGLNNFNADPELQRVSDEAMAEVDEYTRGAIDRLTAAPDDSALSHMIHTGLDGGPPRTYDDLIGTIRVIILGGFQEPGHGAAASLLGILQDPETQLTSVLADPSTNIPHAVHEGLRWIAPFGFTGRRAIADLEIGGVTIPAGGEISIACGSANRDERRYDDPDRFDLHRPRMPHASFGYGAHFCSGHFISRQLERIALEEVFSGLPGIRLDPDRPPVVHGFAVRGVKSLPVVWDR
jgi:cytochrome P450